MGSPGLASCLGLAPDWAWHLAWGWLPTGSGTDVVVPDPQAAGDGSPEPRIRRAEQVVMAAVALAPARLYPRHGLWWRVLPHRAVLGHKLSHHLERPGSQAPRLPGAPARGRPGSQAPPHPTALPGSAPCPGAPTQATL